MEVPRADVVALAKSLAAMPPQQVPAALPLGDHLLTAAEALLALASAVRGEDPCTVTPVRDPDPHSDGLGWGTVRPP